MSILKASLYAIAVFSVVIAIAVIVDMLLAIPIMICWNFVMPYLFGLPKITWLMAYAINVLLSIILIKPTYNKTLD